MHTFMWNKMPTNETYIDQCDVIGTCSMVFFESEISMRLVSKKKSSTLNACVCIGLVWFGTNLFHI